MDLYNVFPVKTEHGTFYECHESLKMKCPWRNPIKGVLFNDVGFKFNLQYIEVFHNDKTENQCRHYINFGPYKEFTDTIKETSKGVKRYRINHVMKINLIASQLQLQEYYFTYSDIGKVVIDTILSNQDYETWNLWDTYFTYSKNQDVVKRAMAILKEYERIQAYRNRDIPLF